MNVIKKNGCSYNQGGIEGGTINGNISYNWDIEEEVDKAGEKPPPSSHNIILNAE